MSALEPFPEATGRRLLVERSGGICEAGADGAATDAHHRFNRSQGGLWTPENLLHLCRFHHAWITEHPAGAKLKGWALDQGMDPVTQPVFMARWGYVLLTRDGQLIQTRTPLKGTKKTRRAS